MATCTCTPARSTFSPNTMAPKLSPSRIPADMKYALDCITGCVCAFDRLTISVDDSALPPELGPKLAAYCRDVKISPIAHPYHRIWNTKVELYQPTQQALQTLHRGLQNRSMTRVSYVEIAIDWLTQDQQHASRLGGYLLEHLRVPHVRTPVKFEQATAYFNQRAAAGSSSGVTLFYTDRRSKLLARKYPEPCCHLERRLRGHAACVKIGLGTVADCVQFDHAGFWKSALRLYDFRSKTALGEILAPKPAVSTTRLREHANLFLDAHQACGWYAGRYVLQDCLRTKPEIRKVLMPLDNRHFLVGVQTS